MCFIYNRWYYIIWWCIFSLSIVCCSHTKQTDIDVLLLCFLRHVHSGCDSDADLSLIQSKWNADHSYEYVCSSCIDRMVPSPSQSPRNSKLCCQPKLKKKKKSKGLWCSTPAYWKTFTDETEQHCQKLKKWGVHLYHVDFD